jgi:hypothetical protein
MPQNKPSKPSKTNLLMPWLGIPIFGSNSWYPHQKQNSDSISDFRNSGRFFLNYNVWKVRKLEFQFAKFGIPVVCLHRNLLRLIVANLYCLQSMHNDLILMVHKLAAPLQHQTADLGGITSCYLMALSIIVMLLACYP